MLKPIFYLLLLMPLLSFSQIGIGESSPDASSALEITSSTKGMLIPRLTQSQRDSISTPATGLIIFQTDNTLGFYYYNGTAWVTFGGGDLDWTTNGNDIYNTNSGNIGVGTINPTTKLHISDLTSSNVFRLTDGSQSNGKLLVSDVNGNASWQDVNETSIGGSRKTNAISSMTIPVCKTVVIGDSGNFNVLINGSTVVVTWTILARDTFVGQTQDYTVSGTTYNVLKANYRSERLQVRYDFASPLPFFPDGILFTAFNNQDYPDTFNINYALKSRTSITANISRVDKHGDIFDGVECWGGQFYFDFIIVGD